MGYSVRVYPDGSFTGGFYSDRKLKSLKPKRAIDSDNSPNLDSTLALLNQIWGHKRMLGVGQPGFRWIDERGLLREIIWVGEGNFASVAINTRTFQWKVQHHAFPVAKALAHQDATPLGLSVVPIFENLNSSATQRKLKGLKGMTPYMRRLIRGSGTILQSYVGKDTLSFLTVTVPPLSQAQLVDAWHQWQDIVDELKKYLEYHAKTKGIKEFLYVYCTEVQEKRFRATEQAYPHLHVVYTGRAGRKRPWARTPRQIRNFWNRLLCRRLGIQLRDFPSENLQRVRHSVAGYLAKYLTKNGSSLSISALGAGGTLTRGIHWGGVSRRLLDWFRQSTIKLQPGGIDSDSAAFLECLPVARNSGLLHYHRRIIVLARDTSNGIERGIPCYSGFLRGLRIPDSRNPVAVIRATLATRISLVCGASVRPIT